MTEFVFKDRFFAHHRRLHQVENCGCPARRYSKSPTDASYFHVDAQDTTSPAWQALLRLIDECAADRRTVFAPGLELEPDLWRQIKILPAAISKLHVCRTSARLRKSSLCDPTGGRRNDSAHKV